MGCCVWRRTARGWCELRRVGSRRSRASETGNRKPETGNRKFQIAETATRPDHFRFPVSGFLFPVLQPHIELEPRAGERREDATHARDALEATARPAHEHLDR